jgi:hypothetical protein
LVLLDCAAHGLNRWRVVGVPTLMHKSTYAQGVSATARTEELFQSQLGQSSTVSRPTRGTRPLCPVSLEAWG